MPTPNPKRLIVIAASATLIATLGIGAVSIQINFRREQPTDSVYLLFVDEANSSQMLRLTSGAGVQRVQCADAKSKACQSFLSYLASRWEKSKEGGNTKPILAVGGTLAKYKTGKFDYPLRLRIKGYDKQVWRPSLVTSAFYQANTKPADAESTEVHGPRVAAAQSASDSGISGSIRVANGSYYGKGVWGAPCDPFADMSTTPERKIFVPGTTLRDEFRGPTATYTAVVEVRDEILYSVCMD